MVTEPQSMSECLYFTNRDMGEGWVKAWAYRIECPKCKKQAMGKPIKDNGKPDKKAPVYECAECKHTIPNAEAEELAKIEATYKCPHCGKEGSGEGPYKRKTYMGVKAYVINCEHCNEKIGITKKLKDIKKK